MAGNSGSRGVRTDTLSGTIHVNRPPGAGDPLAELLRMLTTPPSPSDKIDALNLGYATDHTSHPQEHSTMTTQPITLTDEEIAQADNENSDVTYTYNVSVTVMDDDTERVVDTYDEEFTLENDGWPTLYDIDNNTDLAVGEWNGPSLEIDYDADEADGHGLVTRSWSGSASLDIPVTGRNLDLSIRVDLIRTEREVTFYHDMPKWAGQCECSACLMRDPQGRQIEKDAIAIVEALRLDMHEPNLTVPSSTASGLSLDFGRVRLPNGDCVAIAQEHVGMRYPSVKVFISSMWSDADQLARSAILKAIERKGYEQVDTVPHANTVLLLRGKPRLFKVTGPDGEAIHGGSFTYDPPKHDDTYTGGGWTPGAWTPDVQPVMCRTGYHLTLNPIEWMQADSKVWDAEGRGFAAEIDGAKLDATSARLLRPVDLASIMPLTAAVLTFFDEVAKPAIDEAIARLKATGVTTERGELPDWARLVAPNDTYGPLAPEAESGRTRQPGEYEDPRSHFHAQDWFIYKVRAACGDDLDAYNLYTISEATGRLIYLRRDTHRAEALWSLVAEGYYPVAVEVPFGKVLVQQF